MFRSPEFQMHAARNFVRVDAMIDEIGEVGAQQSFALREVTEFYRDAPHPNLQSDVIKEGIRSVEFMVWSLGHVAVVMPAYGIRRAQLALAGLNPSHARQLVALEQQPEQVPVG